MNKQKKYKIFYPVAVCVFGLLVACFLLISWKAGPEEPTFDNEEICELEVVWYSEGQAESLKRADERMYEDKRRIREEDAQNNNKG